MVPWLFLVALMGLGWYLWAVLEIELLKVALGVGGIAAIASLIGLIVATAPLLAL